VPRFLQSFDETLDGGLILPRGLRDTAASLAEQAGSRLEVTDGRATGTAQEFTFAATLTAEQEEAVAELTRIGNQRYQNLLNARRDTCAA
jgi:hypothetical protein